MIEFDFKRAFKGAESLCSYSAEDIAMRLFQMEIETLNRFETGDLSNEDFHKEIQRVLESEFEYDVFAEIWSSIFKVEIPHMSGLLLGIKENGIAQTACLSNTNAIHVEHLKKTWPRLNDFDVTFYSNEVRARKPDPEIYKHALDHFNIPPNKVLFLDDMAENIEAAEKHDIQGIHVTSAQNVIEGLLKAGFSQDQLNQWMEEPHPENSYIGNTNI